tara:strand:- start:135 stop:245 length:111 start_codon:yes stop_codon:yes gene_type:complete
MKSKKGRISLSTFINTQKIVVEPWVEGETDEKQLES